MATVGIDIGIGIEIGAQSLKAVVTDDDLTALARAGAPRRPEDLQWPRIFYRDAVRHAREIRDRYTFLDLAADSGMLEP